MSGKIAFTPSALDSLRSGARSDPLTPGLSIEALSQGKKKWRYERRVVGSDAKIKMTLGLYPAHTIATAREWARGLNDMVEAGINPREVQRAADERASMTVSKAHGLYMEAAREGRASRAKRKNKPRTIADKLKIYRCDIEPKLGKTSIYDVTETDLIKLVKAKGRTAKVRANRLAAELGVFFGWASSLRGLEVGLEENPARRLADLRFPEAPRKRKLSLEEIRWYLRAVAEEDDRDFRRGFILFLLTAVRFSELTKARRAEVDQGIWTIPSGRSKNSSAHMISLGPWARVLMATNSEWLFPAPRVVTADAYIEAGGGIVRDLFEADGGGWLTDPALLDRLVDEKLKAEGEALLEEGWKWVATSVDLPWEALRDHREIDRDVVPMTAEEKARAAELEAEGEEIDREWSEAEEVPDDIHARVDAINAEYAAIEKRPLTFAPEEIAVAGVFVSLDRDGSIRIDRGYVRPEDEPVEDEEAVGDDASGAGAAPVAERDAAVSAQVPEDADDGEGTEELKPLPDRLVSDLTAWRTLALQDAFAKNPATAYLALLHALVLGCFYSFSKESCLQVSASRVYFSNAPSNLRDCAPAEAIDARGAEWKERLCVSDQYRGARVPSPCWGDGACVAVPINCLGLEPMLRPSDGARRAIRATTSRPCRAAWSRPPGSPVDRRCRCGMQPSSALRHTRV